MAALSAIRNIGTAAARNTGTSGAVVPLLNAANTFGSNQVVAASADLGGLTINGAFANVGLTLTNTAAGNPGTWAWYSSATGSGFGAGLLALSRNVGAPALTVSTGDVVAFRVGPTVGANVLWHAGNDGAGSTLDADLLDGLHASAFGQLAIANTWAAAQTFSASARFNANPEVPAGIYTRYGVNGTNDWYLGKPNATELYLYRDAGVAWIMNGSGLEIVLGSLLAPLRLVTGVSGTLSRASHANRMLHITGGVTINPAVFQAGDKIPFYIDSASNVVFTQGAGLTMRLGGTATTGNRTALLRGQGEMYFPTASECVVSGAVS